jgi:hypothetical protein
MMLVSGDVYLVSDVRSGLVRGAVVSILDMSYGHADLGPAQQKSHNEGLSG